MRLPVDPAYGKVLVAAAGMGCAEEALAIVAMASTDPVFVDVRCLAPYLSSNSFLSSILFPANILNSSLTTLFITPSSIVLSDLSSRGYNGHGLRGRQVLGLTPFTALTFFQRAKRVSCPIAISHNFPQILAYMSSVASTEKLRRKYGKSLQLNYQS